MDPGSDFEDVLNSVSVLRQGFLNALKRMDRALERSRGFTPQLPAQATDSEELPTGSRSIARTAIEDHKGLLEEIESAKGDYQLYADQLLSSMTKVAAGLKDKSNTLQQERKDHLDSKKDAENLFGYQTVAKNTFNLTAISSNAGYLRTVIDLNGVRYRTFLIILLVISIPLQVFLGVLILRIAFFRTKARESSRASNEVVDVERGDKTARKERRTIASRLGAPEPHCKSSSFSATDSHVSYYITLISATVLILNILIAAFEPSAG